MEFKLPETPGIYIFKDKEGTPIYIGKAINLRKRVKDHFRGSYDQRENSLISKIKSIDWIKVDSEIEALILEANLIKKHKPHFNSQFKDDKDYLYIKITKDSFPRVLTARKKDLAGAKVSFGPFPSATKVRMTLKTLRRIFKFSNCKPNQKRACFYYHLGLCAGVCVGKINEKEYKKIIRQLIYFLEGKIEKVLKLLDEEQNLYSQGQQYEKALETKKTVEAIRYVTAPIRSPEIYLEEDSSSIRERELKELSEAISLKESPNRIECYDISNIFGKSATGSMVVFQKGEADKSEYRRFKIKTVKQISDVAMMAEVLARRFGNSWPKPDLIVVDGGRTQVNAALRVLENLKKEIPVMGLAKRLEEIYLPDKVKPIRLSRRSDALKLVQRLRDEAHRFALSYHHKLREKEFLTGV